MSAVLDGLLVVSLEQAVAAPLASRYLADAGARVIKVEREGGDFARGYDTVVRGMSAYFVWLNRGKESAVLDIKAPEDAALLHRMLGRADVFIQNLAPGAAGRAGFGSEQLRERYPRLVTCDIAGFGPDTPLAGKRAYDLLVQAESGLCSVTGTAEGPGRVGVSVCDFAAGMNAAIGILEALHGRERSGRGSAVRVSLFDSMADWMSVPLAWQEFRDEAPKRVGLAHPSIAPYGAYPSAGGALVLISIQNQREWRRLCAQVLGDPGLADAPDFATNEARVANRAGLDARIGAVFRTLSRDALTGLLDAAEIAYGVVSEVADLARHPALHRARVDLPAGPVHLVASPVVLDGGARLGAPARAPSVPEAGRHTESIRREFV